jgi:hypothetical protein
MPWRKNIERLKMSALFMHYLAYVFIPSFIVFCIIWYKQRASLPASLGLVRLIGVFAAVWSSAFVTFAVLSITTALAGYENLSEFERTATGCPPSSSAVPGKWKRLGRILRAEARDGCLASGMDCK